MPPSYPVILPPPQNLTFGSAGPVLIDPCDFILNATITSTAPVDNQTIIDNINYILNHNVFYKSKDCSSKALSDQISSPQIQTLHVVIKNQTTSRLVPPSLWDTNESYNLTMIDNSSIWIEADQYSGVARGLSTLS